MGKREGQEVEETKKYMEKTLFCDKVYLRYTMNRLLEDTLSEENVCFFSILVFVYLCMCMYIHVWGCM